MCEKSFCAALDFSQEFKLFCLSVKQQQQLEKDNLETTFYLVLNLDIAVSKIKVC